MSHAFPDARREIDEPGELALDHDTRDLDADDVAVDGDGVVGQAHTRTGEKGASIRFEQPCDARVHARRV